MLCIGLFGTCGGSNWRNTFMSYYDQNQIEYFNPQVENWKPELAEIEAEHLASDEIILFPVTNETYGLGSLAETGFSILNAIKLDDRRDFIIMIDQNLDQKLIDANPLAAKESLRGRALVKQHLKKLRFSNLYVVNDLFEMLDVSVVLWNARQLTKDLKRYNIAK